ncbi:MAG: SusC/RagA family TonB-linked outer membrane protein, partial [Bacteroidales bacterium]|nr:SusC/RagA family TonB-linked outer membrane protein [Bacteroidales bacterium]
MKSNLPISIFIILIILSVLSVTSFGQEEGYTLNGTIINTNEEPISDVAVSIEGVNKEPSVTDENGKFEISVPSGDIWLLINPVQDFHSKRIYLNQRDYLTIYLTSSDIESGNEKINFVLGSKERRDIISSYNTHNTEERFYYPYETVDQFFQGNIQGMYVTNSSGMPGSATSINIRGIKSLYTNNQPLYVVDGIPLETLGLFDSDLGVNTYNSLASVEPFDISNITVLKDNYATSMYGMRGSNGVVLIETLKPTELKTTIDLSVKTGISMRPDRYIPQMSSTQYRTYANEVLLTSNFLEENFAETYPALYSNSETDDYHRYKHETNWQDEIFRVGTMNDINLRIKGGDEIARYGLSVGYLNHEGIINNADYKRVDIRMVGTFNIFQWLRMYISSSLVTSSSNLVESALSRETSPILTSLSKTPMMFPYSFDRDGNQLSTLDDVGCLEVSNPNSIIENYRGLEDNYHTLNSIRLEGDLSDHIKLNSLFGINLNTLSDDIFMPNYGMALYYNGTAYNVSKNVKNFLFSTYNDNSISYMPDLGNLHGLKVDAGFRWNTNRFEQDLGISKNSHENDEYESLQHGVFYLKEIGGQTNKWNRMSVYSNLNYSYKNKYLLNVGVSAENSTRLGDNTDLPYIGNVPFATFYCIGGGWRISSEDFLKNTEWIEDMKLKASYSVSGNDDIGNANAFNYLLIDHYRETSAVVPGNLTDGSLKNETIKHLSTGFDPSLLGNRMNFSMDYYNIMTEDMLVYVPQSYYSGYTFLPMNNGAVNNTGIDLKLNLRVINGSDFKWDVNAYVTPWQKNVVKEIEDDRMIIDFPGGQYISEVGKSALEFYGYQFEGVYATSQEAKDAGLKNDKGISFIAGDAKFTDISGPNGKADSIINDYDKISLGSATPDLYGGFNTTFQYKRFSLNMDIYFVLGNEVFNYLRYENEKMSDLSNQSSAMLNRWEYEGHETDVPRALWNDPIGNSSFSSRWIEDGSFLRIKNLTIAYTI